MSAERIIRWTCDRCKHAEERRSGRELRKPDGWGGATITGTPSLVLCPKCLGDVRAFATNTPGADVAIRR